MTVTRHGNLGSNEVYHPAFDGELIGQVFDNRPELDIALVKLTPWASSRFDNSFYFQAEPPTHLLLESQFLKQGSWSEVNDMSSGLFSMLHVAVNAINPIRPPGHPKIPFAQWDLRSVSVVLGLINDAMSDGVCGAPIVDCKTGGVGGFFHSTDGGFAFFATINDLVAEGWQIAFDLFRIFWLVSQSDFSLFHLVSLESLSKGTCRGQVT